MLPDASFSIETLIRITESDAHPNPVIPTPTRPPLWVLKHDVELGNVRNVTLSNGAPEVHRMEPYHMTRFRGDWQYLSKEINPNMSYSKWISLYSWTTVITNEQGFGKPGDPRADFVGGTNLQYELPKVADLLFGGNVYTGKPEGEWLWVETLDTSKPAPPLEYILSKRWLYQIGTNVRKDGQVGKLPQGNGMDVLLPVYASKPVKIQLSKLRRLRDDEPIPSPYL